MKQHKFRKFVLVVQVLCLIYLAFFTYYNTKAFEVYPQYADLVESDSSLYHIWSTLFAFSFIPGIICSLGGFPVFIACVVGIIKYFVKHRQDKWLLFYSLTSMVMVIAIIPFWATFIETHQV